MFCALNAAKGMVIRMVDYKRIKKEKLKNDWVELAKGVRREEFERALDFAVGIVSDNLKEFTYKFPSSGGVDGRYKPTENADEFLYSDWTSSFWTGMIWLCYELTGDEKFKKVGLIHSESFRERYEKNIILDHHDIGFLYTLSCVAAYKATGDEFSKETALLAAKKLASRYREKAGIIQVRGMLDDLNSESTGEFIIDCCMNLPLLYWAAGETGEKKYYDMAYSHICHVVDYMIKDDASTHQNFVMDINTGEPLRGFTGQGDGNPNGCWSRGQAWAIYGLPISYVHTGDASLLEAAKRCANYFLNRLQSDRCANWDFLYKKDSDQRDTSAVAVAACGMLELAKQLPLYDPDREMYESAAKVLVSDLIKNYMYTKEESGNALLKAGVYAYKLNLCVNEPVIWGDYYFMEALVRLLKYFRMYW